MTFPRPRPPSRPAPNGRPGDPLDVQATLLVTPEPLPRTTAFVIREAYRRGFVAGLAQPIRGRRRRMAAAAVVIATLALVMTAFQAGRIVAAPRSAQVNPSGPGTTATTTPELSGAPSTSEPSSATAPPFDPSSFPPIGYGVPNPAGGISKAPLCSGPCETWPPRPAVSRGTAGEASWWYSVGPGLYAAIRPDLGHKGDLAVVCGGRPFHCLTLPIITTCACLGPGSGRLIDISRDAFVSFAPPGFWPGTKKPRKPGWQGTIRITLQVIGR